MISVYLFLLDQDVTDQVTQPILYIHSLFNIFVNRSSNGDKSFLRKFFETMPAKPPFHLTVYAVVCQLKLSIGLVFFWFSVLFSLRALLPGLGNFSLSQDGSAF